MPSLRRLAWKLAAGAAAPLALYVVLGGAWERHRASIAAWPEHRITAERIAVTAQPKWIHGDVKAEAIRDGALDELSALDRGAVERVERAFALHTWVARVATVRKRYPAVVEVDLEFRRPMAMVEVVGGLYPIDREGVLLPPSNFAEIQVRDYLRVNVGKSSPAGPVGTPWGDDLVADAACIAGALANDWKTIGLYRLRALDAEQARLARLPAEFALETRQGARVVWGRAPGKESTGEPSAATKIARLVTQVKQVGSLDAPRATLDFDLSREAPSAKMRTVGSRP